MPSRPKPPSKYPYPYQQAVPHETTERSTTAYEPHYSPSDYDPHPSHQKPQHYESQRQTTYEPHLHDLHHQPTSTPNRVPRDSSSPSKQKPKPKRNPYPTDAKPLPLQPPPYNPKAFDSSPSKLPRGCKWIPMETLTILSTVLRLLHLLLLIPLTALLATLRSDTHPLAPGSVFSTLNFCLVAVVVSWVSVVFALFLRYVPQFLPSLPIPSRLRSVQVPLDAAAAVFTLIAAIVLSAKLGVVDCGKLFSKDDADRAGYEWLEGVEDYIPLWSMAEGGESKEDLLKMGEGRCRMVQGGDVLMYFVGLLSCVAAGVGWWGRKDDVSSFGGGSGSGGGIGGGRFGFGRKKEGVAMGGIV